MRAVSVGVEFASRQVSKFSLIEGRFRCDPTGAMKEVQGKGNDVVTIDPWQETRSLDPGRNLDAYFQNCLVAMRAPSAMAANFAHTTSGSTAAWPTQVP